MNHRRSVTRPYPNGSLTPLLSITFLAYDFRYYLALPATLVFHNKATLLKSLSALRNSRVQLHVAYDMSVLFKQ
jgi:hypothetical protein